MMFDLEAFSNSSAQGCAVEGGKVSTTSIQLMFFDYNTGTLNDPNPFSFRVLNL